MYFKIPIIENLFLWKKSINKTIRVRKIIVLLWKSNIKDKKIIFIKISLLEYFLKLISKISINNIRISTVLAKPEDLGECLSKKTIEFVCTP